MACTACGTELVDDARFCHHCGAPTGPLNEAARHALEPPAKRGGADVSPGVARFMEAATSGRDQGDDDDKEETLWSGAYSSRAMTGTWLVTALVTLLVIIAAFWWNFGMSGWLWTLGLIILGWLVLYLRLLYKQLTMHYTLTNQRLEIKRGLLSRSTDRIEVIDMDDITFVQGPIERLFNVGSVTIKSSDVTDPKFTMAGIERVDFVARTMDDARRRERRRRGLHIESI